jgi:hypothetical protein
MTKAFEKSGQKSSLTTMDLPHITALYKAVLKAPARENTLFSKQFSEMESFVKKEFFLDKIGFEGWISILDITETTTPKKLGAIIQELKKGGERPSANDLGLLATATVSSEAKAELMDRTTNLETLRKVYSRPPVVRRLPLDTYALTQEAKGYLEQDPNGSNQKTFENLQRLNDQIETIKLDELPSLLLKRDAEIKRLEEEGGLGNLSKRRLVTERKISQTLANYTERPAAESLSRLDLARIGRVVSSLENSSFRAAIGKQLELDLEDTKGDDPNRIKTELGGTFDNFRQRLEVRPIESQSRSDGEYQPEIDARIHGGLLFHHFHASAEDARKSAGPSGSVSTGGDFGVARDFNSAGIVMTPVGNAVDREGKVIPGLRLINIDYYNPQGQTVDLGVYEVPVSDTAALETLSSRYIPRSTETMTLVK